MSIELYNEDCLIGMQRIPAKSVDAIICDLPYGTTKNAWDVVIPFDALWERYERMIKDNGAIILFGQGTFAYKLALSNEKLFRYDLIWSKKGKATGFLNANKMPLRSHESILLFYKKLPTYNPQKTEGVGGGHSRGKGDKITNNCYGKFDNQVYSSPTEGKHPLSILEFPSVHPPVHPTQKSDLLIEWLIKSYTNEGDTVLDNTMGSGTTGVACVNTDRNFIGFELDKTYFEIAKNRIDEALLTKLDIL